MGEKELEQARTRFYKIRQGNYERIDVIDLQVRQDGGGRGREATEEEQEDLVGEEGAVDESAVRTCSCCRHADPWRRSGTKRKIKRPHTCA
jgi:hypothetical protein